MLIQIVQQNIQYKKHLFLNIRCKTYEKKAITKKYVTAHIGKEPMREHESFCLLMSSNNKQQMNN
jgi:hypothetical protein